jgi:hypothetical protein
MKMSPVLNWLEKNRWDMANTKRRFVLQNIKRKMIIPYSSSRHLSYAQRLYSLIEQKP